MFNPRARDFILHHPLIYSLQTYACQRFLRIFEILLQRNPLYVASSSTRTLRASDSEGSPLICRSIDQEVNRIKTTRFPDMFGRTFKLDAFVISTFARFPRETRGTRTHSFRPFPRFMHVYVHAHETCAHVK